jgi:hypothetical protein
VVHPASARGTDRSRVVARSGFKTYIVCGSTLERIVRASHDVTVKKLKQEKREKRETNFRSRNWLSFLPFLLLHFSISRE